MKSLAFGLILLASFTSRVAAGEKLRPEPLPGSGSSLTWEGPQFLQADQKGRVFFLDAKSLRVYPLRRDGELGEPQALKPIADQGDGSFPTRAALSPDGSDWLVYRFGPSGGLRYFRAGEEKSLPQMAWSVASVGLPGGRPIVAAGPGMKSSVTGVPVPEEPPLLLGLAGTRWETLVSEPFDLQALGAEGSGHVKIDNRFINALQASRDVLLANGPKASLWMAARNSYRLRRFSPGGRLLTEIKLGEGKIEFRRRSSQEVEASKATAADAKSPEEGRWIESIMAAPTAKKAIEAFTAAPDGTIYAVTAPSDQGSTLDRFDPVRGVLERVALHLPEKAVRIQIAAGRDGLYLANGSGSGGRWWLAWEAVEQAKWREVFEAEVTSRRSK